MSSLENSSILPCGSALLPALEQLSRRKAMSLPREAILWYLLGIGAQGKTGNLTHKSNSARPGGGKPALSITPLTSSLRSNDHYLSGTLMNKFSSGR
jgi:hypothetical protein